MGRDGGLLAEESPDRDPVPSHRVRNGAERTHRIRKSNFILEFKLKKSFKNIFWLCPIWPPIYSTKIRTHYFLFGKKNRVVGG